MNIVDSMKRFEMAARYIASIFTILAVIIYLAFPKIMDVVKEVAQQYPPDSQFILPPGTKIMIDGVATEVFGEDPCPGGKTVGCVTLRNEPATLLFMSESQLRRESVNVEQRSGRSYLQWRDGSPVIFANKTRPSAQ